MKTKLFPILAMVLLASCLNQSTYTGPPVIVKKVTSLDGETCTYTYIGYGREDWFEDPCNKYNVGDTLKGNQDGQN